MALTDTACRRQGSASAVQALRWRRAPSRQAFDGLREVKKVARASALVFPSIRFNARPLSENAMNAALRRMESTQDETTAHGFRASASSILKERGFPT